MIAKIMMTPHEATQHLASKARLKRLSLNLSQKTLSQRSGVSYGVLKKFEQTGQISLESLLKLALSLNSIEEFYDLFNLTSTEHVFSLDELLEEKTRKRGRK